MTLLPGGAPQASYSEWKEGERSKCDDDDDDENFDS